MSASVRISRKAAQRILTELEKAATLAWIYVRDVEELRAALRPSPKLRASKRAKVARKTANRKTKAEQTKEIREAIWVRSGGSCEAACGFWVTWNAGVMDHWHGRGKEKQSVENCWFICNGCDHAKTHNRPSAAAWLEKWRAHCIRNDLRSEAIRAGREIDSLADITEASRLTGFR